MKSLGVIFFKEMGKGRGGSIIAMGDELGDGKGMHGWD